jgi:hypothetical protein
MTEALMTDLTEKREVVDPDPGPAPVDDHPFEPRGAWYTLCKHCGLGEAAHKETTIDWRDYIAYYDDDD